MGSMRTDWFRSLVRPVVTLSGWFVFLFLAIRDGGDIRLAFVAAMGIALGFWFQSRVKKD